MSLADFMKLLQDQKIKFLVTRDVKYPERKVGENAGIDVYIPSKESFTEEELASIGGLITGDEIQIEPLCNVRIPVGLYCKFPDNNRALIAHNKSGIAGNKSLVLGACVIDSSYQGEWIVDIHNISNEIQTIKFGQKITQFVETLIGMSEVDVVTGITPDEFFDTKSERGAGGFGSTGV